MQVEPTRSKLVSMLKTNRKKLLFFATKEFEKSIFGNKKSNPSSSMITMNFQIFYMDEIMLVILQNNLHQPFNSILQQEIINTKCRNGKK